MPERRLPTSAPAAAGPRRHSRRLRRRCRLLLLPAFALALLSVAYLSFSPYPNLPFREKQHGMAGMNNAGERMNQRHTPDDLSTKVKANFSMTKDELEPYKRRKKSRKHYVPCQIEFLPLVDSLVEPIVYSNFTGFSLKYILKENVLSGNGLFEPLFGGHQSLQEREETYYARNQTLHCGFVQGPDDYPSTGFDLNENDKMYMASCRVVVSSCILEALIT